MKRVKRCCSPLWELQKAKAREKKEEEKKERQCVTAVSESCTDNSDHSVLGASVHHLLGFHLPLPISGSSKGKPHEDL